MKKSELKGLFMNILSLVILAVLGMDAGVMMAAATDLPEAGNSENSGGKNPNETAAGIATETQGREEGDEEMYQKDVDSKIVKIRPMSTPLDQISRYASAGKTDSFEVKYYSVGTRPIKTTLKTKVTAQTSGNSVVLDAEDASMFSLDDTILVVDQPGYADKKGQHTSTAEPTNPPLQLCVCGIDASTGSITVFAVNGTLNTSTNEYTYVPEIAAGKTLIRMGKACGELDVQTARFNNLPSAEVQYCQNFMIQVEQSTFDKIAKKEVDWGFSDLEEDSVFDMRLTEEASFLFGNKGIVHHPTKGGMAQWFTGGVWYMAGKDITIGKYDTSKNIAVLTDNDLVDLAKDLFVGTGTGNKRKVMFCGSGFLAALSKIESEKFRLKETVDKWDLHFTSWNTNFGEVLTIHHELFDLVGKTNEAFAMDPEYLSKKVHVGWSRNILDLKKAGVRNTDAVVLQEVACLYLRYPKAHARIKLATA